MNNNESYFYHALKVDSEICMGCTHCMQSCPTEAIRVRNGVAVIIENKCIDCGECFKVCPVKAIYIKQDDFSLIFNYKYRIALVPAVFIGQFPEEIRTSEIYACLKKIGFTHIYEVEHGVGYMISFFNDYFKKHSDKSVFISSFCPAVVRLIQVRFPSLVENIIHLKAPLDVSAIMITQRLTEAGIQKEDIGVFYVTPCAAKIAAVKSPVENTKSIINGVINMDFLYNKVQKMLHTDKSNVEPINHSLTGRDVKWSLSGGEATNFGENGFAVDGLKNVIEFLEKLENDEIDTSGLIEMRVCDQSCAGGILNVNNRFVAVQRLLKRANYLDQKLDGRYCFVPEIGTNFYSRVSKQMDIDEIKPRPIDKLANNYKTALLMKNEIEQIKAKLPSVDCGACGSPNCAALAEDIVKGFATINNCVFLDAKCKSIKRINTEIWNKNKKTK